MVTTYIQSISAVLSAHLDLDNSSFMGVLMGDVLTLASLHPLINFIAKTVLINNGLQYFAKQEKGLRSIKINVTNAQKIMLQKDT